MDYLRLIVAMYVCTVSTLSYEVLTSGSVREKLDLGAF